MSESEITILKAAAAILQTDGIERARAAVSMDERKCANAALLASVTITEYFDLADRASIPF